MRDEWFRVALDMIDDGVVTADATGRITFTNTAADALFDRDQLAGLFGHKTEDVERPLTIASKAGRQLHLLLDTAPIVDAAGALSGQVLVIRDVTERVRFREQIAKNDRLAGLGALSAGIAHELNNPLAVISTNVEFSGGELRHLAAALEEMSARVGSMLGAVTQLNEAMVDSTEGSDRMRRLVEDVRAYSLLDPRPTALDPRTAVELAVRICSLKSKRRARIRTVLEETPKIEGNEGILAQVLVNLITNAFEAISEVEGEAQEVTISASTDDRGRVCITVRDTGPGMSEDVRAHMFEPFFSTKPSGSGLGLAIVRRLVSELGGEIAVATAPGRGTEISLYFVPSESAPSAKRPERKLPRARVLVIDDEPLILQTIRRLLGKEHEVVDTLHPLEALVRIKKGERFDMILCDLIMPELAGWDFYDQLATLVPEQAEACVFLTGAALHPQARAFLDRVENRRVEKPFDSETLGSALREVLQEHGRLATPQPSMKP